MPREVINGCLYIPGEELEEWEADEVYSALNSGNMQVVKHPVHRSRKQLPRRGRD